MVNDLIENSNVELVFDIAKYNKSVGKNGTMVEMLKYKRYQVQCNSYSVLARYELDKQQWGK